LIELKDLAGKQHLLSGVEYRPDTGNGASISFCLSGITYTAIENPSDGYRSSMRELIIGGSAGSGFEPCLVEGRMTPDDGDRHDILELVDGTTHKVVLAVGTRRTDDYYPSFIVDWQPQNLRINQPEHQAGIERDEVTAPEGPKHESWGTF
jgi:hypothetical protein